MKEKKKERSLLIFIYSRLWLWCVWGCWLQASECQSSHGFISGRTGVQMIATVIPCTESGRVSRITYFFVKINTGIDQVCASDEVIDLIF